jgi:hypothetical protein
LGEQEEAEQMDCPACGARAWQEADGRGRWRARIATGPVWEELPRGIASTGSVGELMGRLISLCESYVPNPRWRQAAGIGWDDGAAALSRWLRATLEANPPPPKVRGLWFPLVEFGAEWGPRADLSIAGTSTYDPDDAEFAWLDPQNQIYDPGSHAGSDCLAQMSQLVSTSPLLSGSGADWALALGFAVVAVGVALDGLTAPALAPEADRIGVATGWADGDFMRIGELTGTGFSPSPLQ